MQQRRRYWLESQRQTTRESFERVIVFGVSRHADACVSPRVRPVMLVNRVSVDCFIEHCHNIGYSIPTLRTTGTCLCFAAAQSTGRK
jgi:hypothetical protein